MSWFTDLWEQLSKPVTVERPSPKIRITLPDAEAIVSAVRQIPGYADCFLAGIAPTNSMEAGIDDGMYVILQPVPHTDLIVGDIIWWEVPPLSILHRIVETGNDPDWYCITKGDNNGARDSVKVRPYAIKGVWRMTLD